MNNYPLPLDVVAINNLLQQESHQSFCPGMWRLSIRLPYLKEKKVSSVSCYLQRCLPLHLLQKAEEQISAEELIRVQPGDDPPNSV